MGWLTDIETAADAATPGPWWASEDLDDQDPYESAIGVCRGSADDDETYAVVLVTPGSASFSAGIMENREANAMFAALSRVAVPRLVALVKELGEALGRSREELNCWGWGDMHYGNTPQERRVVDAVADADAALAKYQEAVK